MSRKVQLGLDKSRAKQVLDTAAAKVEDTAGLAEEALAVLHPLTRQGLAARCNGVSVAFLTRLAFDHKDGIFLTYVGSAMQRCPDIIRDIQDAFRILRSQANTDLVTRLRTRIVTAAAKHQVIIGSLELDREGRLGVRYGRYTFWCSTRYAQENHLNVGDEVAFWLPSIIESSCVALHKL